MLYQSKLNNRVIDNFKDVRYLLLLPALLILGTVGGYFIVNCSGGGYCEFYAGVQKDLFINLNEWLSRSPHLQNNLTQLGDVLIFFPLVSVFVIYAPKLWEALLASAIFSLIAASTLKKLFAVPRPAAMFDNDSFVIIGKALKGSTSLPSGHSIATFVVISILLFAFMPKKSIQKTLWMLFILTFGLFIAISRVGVGAHYPLDVVVGSTIGFIVTVLGVKVCNKRNWLSCLSNKKYRPVLILILLGWSGAIISKIVDKNLPIFYLSLLALIVTLCLILKSYVWKKSEAKLFRVNTQSC
ncbi:phosphatase PAP2 family protein [Prolixibacteraceae bacterium JC049]|nr:phosphatase PAP2 family protein [Prolixibacteraceae bacterium JC049]